MSEECLKCGYIRVDLDIELAPDYECPKCGIVYAKAERIIANQALLSDEDKIKKIKKLSEEERKKESVNDARLVEKNSNDKSIINSLLKPFSRLSSSREAVLDFELSTNSEKAYDALLYVIGQTGLKIKSEDKSGRTLVAEQSLLKSMLSNSYGEVVIFTVTEQGSMEHCLVKLHCRGKAPIGSYSHKSIFKKTLECLQGDFEVGVVKEGDPTKVASAGAVYSARTWAVARTEKLDGELLRAVGANGVVVLFPNKISILRIDGLLTGVLHGMKGDKEIWLSRLTSIQLRKPSDFTKGYIQFELMGGQSSQGGILDGLDDENTVLFDMPDLEAFLQLKDLIESLVSKKQVGLREEQPIKSAAAELKDWKDLLDAGAITQTEYGKKKAELLKP